MRPLALLLFLTLPLMACSVFSSVYKTAGTTLTSQPKRLAVSGEESKSPFTLAVLEELHDGRSLHVHAVLTTKTQWPADAVEARLIGLNNGVKVVEQALLMSDVIGAEKPGEVLSADKEYDLLLSIPSDSVAGYQLELFWDTGQTSTGSGRAFALELRNLAVDQRLRCNTQPCQIGFSLKGEFFNNSRNLLNDARIAVGFVFVPTGTELDLSKSAPENEEQVFLAGLNLAGGSSKPFRLNIKTMVPEREDGSFVPVVRVVDIS